jgi:farnesyl-diphosphate farnesyltransferase
MNDRKILRRTSRSFYLTIRLLPRAVRGDVSLAYLLARATDTIADTSTAPADQRIAMLRAARAALDYGEIAGYDAAAWSRGQRDPSEAELLRALPRWWRQMQSRGEAVRVLLRRVMDNILEGQIFDLERFGPECPPLDREERDRYTYLVAGGVGEFWHDLCQLRLGNYCPDPHGGMRLLARHYGQALQLVNIIRDRRMDDALGRVYLPESDVARAGARAREWLDEGSRYCAGVESGRLRYAMLLPALLGFRTLALAENQPPGTITPAKVPRAELWRWMRRALPVWLSPAAVAPLVRAASK